MNKKELLIRATELKSKGYSKNKIKSILLKDVESYGDKVNPLIAYPTSIELIIRDIIEKDLFNLINSDYIKVNDVFYDNHEKIYNFEGQLINRSYLTLLIKDTFENDRIVNSYYKIRNNRTNIEYNFNYQNDLFMTLYSDKFSTQLKHGTRLPLFFQLRWACYGLYDIKSKQLLGFDTNDYIIDFLKNVIVSEKVTKDNIKSLISESDRNYYKISNTTF